MMINSITMVKKTVLPIKFAVKSAHNIPEKAQLQQKLGNKAASLNN